ncbi:hypothetical protein [Bacillus toyonensis]|uniref:hypothetical protein n=1 Tax=Bacillus toyonensis TaxID=155322 RepID=UPI000BF2BE23|nr:hypothetical protein [Bacillus toyonensis]PGF05167.1 hypothetical protein COM61_01730 [Bacillus toyonensis]
MINYWDLAVIVPCVVVQVWLGLLIMDYLIKRGNESKKNEIKQTKLMRKIVGNRDIKSIKNKVIMVSVLLGVVLLCRQWIYESRYTNDLLFGSLQINVLFLLWYASAFKTKKPDDSKLIQSYAKILGRISISFACMGYSVFYVYFVFKLIFSGEFI